MCRTAPSRLYVSDGVPTSDPDRRRPACLITLLATLALVLSLAPVEVRGFERYNDGCQSCHSSFTSGYSSAATGVVWPSSLHTVHRSSSYMNTDCNLCHRSDDNDDPYLASSDGTGSNPGHGCVGCHGGTTTAGAPSGEAMRRHHVYSGASDCFGACHAPAEPPSQEWVPPTYYGTVDTNVASPCNTDASTSEDWNDDGQGLDSDGDLLYDAADPGCQEGFVFHDGFVAGDGTSWTTTQPSH